MTAPRNVSACILLIPMLLGCPKGAPVTMPPPSAEPSETATPNVTAQREQSDTKLVFVKPKLSDEELRAGWISLFDGTTLFGWDVPTESNWHIEDGAIVADSGDRSLLMTPFAFDDFEFRCDFHLAKGGNSGVFLRSAEVVDDPAAHTYELNICDSHESHKTGSFVGRHVAKGVPEVEGDWHTFHVRCEGTNIKVQLDGKQIVDFTDESDHVRTSGRIGLQMNAGRIAFRNVFLRPLHAIDIFNGKDLSGFREVPGGKSEFAVADGVLHVENGAGFLETEAMFDDFILHVESNIADEKAAFFLELLKSFDDFISFFP